MAYLYPRLDTADATKLISEYSGCSPRTLIAYSATSHPRASIYPTGVQARVPEQVLEQLRAAIRKVAGAHGYPDRGRPRTATPFDQQTATVLARIMFYALPAAETETLLDEIFSAALSHLARVPGNVSAVASTDDVRDSHPSQGRLG